MFQEFRFDCPGGYVKYQIKSDNAYITSCGGKIFEVYIPDSLDGYPVTKIEKKAFMGCKVLKSVSIPGSVSAIGDYAFSACTVLDSVEVRCQNGDQGCIELGQGIFAKDISLKRLSLYGDEKSAMLCGAAASLMNAEYLLLDREHFYSQWDAKLLSILGEADDEGFVFMVLCGEEDLTADIDEFREQRRQLKAELSFLRLIYDTCLDADFRQMLVDYLKEHTCGCESEAAFQVILKYYDNEQYVKLFFDLGLLNDDNYSLVLDRLGDRYAPLKAKILSRHVVERDFFAQLMI